MNINLFVIILFTRLANVSNSDLQRINNDPNIGSLQYCLNSSLGDTPIGRVQCAMIEEEKQKKRMRIVYMSVLQIFSEPQRSSMIQVQQIWSQWLAAKCSFLSVVPGAGSEANSNSAFCRIQTIIERANELEHLQRSFMPNYGDEHP